MIPFWEVEDGFDLRVDLTVFYTNPLIDSVEKQKEQWNKDVWQDYRICAGMSFLVSNYLGYWNDNFPKMMGSIGFESGLFCQSPAQFNPLLTAEVRPEHKCDLD